MSSLGFDLERERNEASETDFVGGGVGPVLKGLSDKVSGIVCACYAWGTPENGVYPRVTFPINHAIDIITEFSKKFLPIGTIQRGRDDWMNCASNAPCNSLEVSFNHALDSNLFTPVLVQWFKDEGYINPENGLFEIADAFVSIGSGTTRRGNSLKSPVQFISNNGIVPKSRMPDSPSMTFDEYHDPARITPELFDLGLEFLKRVKVNYEKVYRADFEKIVDTRWDIFDSYPNYSGTNLKNLANDYIFLEYGYRLYIAEDTTEQQISILRQMINKLMEIIGLKKKQIEILTEPKVEPVEQPKYDWSTKESTRHSCRVIMDEYGLSWDEKDLLCKVIRCESGFDVHAVNANTNDFGIVQVNERYWIGEGKKFPSVDYVLENPEVCVRWMIEEYKKGHLRWWVCYSKGMHLNYKA